MPSPENNPPEKPQEFQPAFSVNELIAPSRRFNWKIMLAVWAVIAGFIYLGCRLNWQPRIVGGGALLLAIGSNALAWLVATLGLVPFIGPLLVKVLALPVVWLLNGIGYIISLVVVRGGGTGPRDVLVSRGMTIALIIGIVIGFVIGKFV